MAEQKEVLKLVLAGHVDHGKSTVIGRLLHDTGALPEGIVAKVRRIARETGNPFEFAYLLDAFEEEQKQGITLDITELQFHSARRDYVLIDAPGHKELLKNMISGAAGAEAAVLVIDAARGVEEQTRRHAYMLSLLGISQVCVIVNKMDLVDYSAAVFAAIREDMTRLASSTGLACPGFIPLSALRGDNVLEPSGRMAWYTGFTLIQALDALVKGPSLDAAPLRLPVQDVYKFDERRILAGRVESGSLQVGDEIVLCPGGKKTRVAKFAGWPENGVRQQAGAGESIGLILEDEFFNRRGEVISRQEALPLMGAAFRASLFWMGKKPLYRGSVYKLKITTQEADAVIEEIVRIVDASSLDVRDTTDEVRLNDVAEVLVKTRVPVVFDLFSTCRASGRFVLVDGHDVSGGGIITAAQEEEFAGFTYKSLRARCELFEEYCYNFSSLNIDKYKKCAQTFTLGDALPLRGASFAYPEFFDVVLAGDKTAVKIRSGKVAELLPLAEYVYEGFPVVDGRGFAFRVNSGADWPGCLNDYVLSMPDREAEFASRWLDFNRYRSISFSRGHE
jgi:sulfate adenylyltransferase large subunit